MIRVAGLTRRYGSRTALADVSFEARPGEILGVLGANGAGKSTLLRVLAGTLTPDAGAIELAGVDPLRDPVEAKRRTGYAPDEPSLYDELGAEEHLCFLAAIRGLDPDESRARALGLLDRLGLAARRAEPVAEYSHGMAKKLSFAAAVLHRPALVLCDEALEGFDVAASVAARHELQALAAAGSTVLLASHVTETLGPLCHRVLILDHGRIVRSEDRAAWGAETVSVSPLERLYLEAILPHAAREGRI